MKPKYAHDCDHCNYLGRFEWDGQTRDLYFCGTHERGTVIARFGDDGPDYSSGIGFAERGIQPYKEALDRAVAAGHYNPQPQVRRPLSEGEIAVARAIGYVEDAMGASWKLGMFHSEDEVELFDWTLRQRIAQCDEDSDEEKAEAAVYAAILAYSEATRRE